MRPRLISWFFCKIFEEKTEEILVKAKNTCFSELSHKVFHFYHSRTLAILKLLFLSSTELNIMASCDLLEHRTWAKKPCLKTGPEILHQAKMKKDSVSDIQLLCDVVCISFQMSYHKACMLLYLLYKFHIMFHWLSKMFYVSQKLIGASNMKVVVK